MEEDYKTKPEDDFSETYGTTIERQDNVNNKGSQLGDDTEESRKKASEIIVKYKDTIIEMAKRYGVNPGILAACIFTEQACNVSKGEGIIDLITGFLTPKASGGIAQIQINTAMMLENAGYVEPLEFIGLDSAGSSMWRIPGVPGIHTGTQHYVTGLRLSDSTECIRYAAAYLTLIQDKWKSKYPTIDGDTKIVATLYNNGLDNKVPHDNPQPSDFGRYARANYYYMRSLLGLSLE